MRLLQMLVVAVEIVEHLFLQLKGRTQQLLKYLGVRFGLLVLITSKCSRLVFGVAGLPLFDGRS